MLIRLYFAILAAAVSAASAAAAPAPAPPSNATAAPATARPAPSPTDDAIAFSKKMTADATAALTKAGATDSQKLAAFREVLSRSLALDVVGKFMLGENRKKMTPTQIARYDAVFPLYITKQYAEQFKDIVGRPLEVIEARSIGARDTIVRTKFTRKSGSPIMVDWRVRKLKDGSNKMIDIIVSGVSIMLVKREEFSSYIAKNGIDSLLARLEKEAKGA